MSPAVPASRCKTMARASRTNERETRIATRIGVVLRTLEGIKRSQKMGSIRGTTSADMEVVSKIREVETSLNSQCISKSEEVTTIVRESLSRLKLR